MRTSHLSPPSEALARRLLARVSYGDRLPAGRLVMPVGFQGSYVRGLEEVQALLVPDARSLPSINLASLADWVDQVLGDPDLSAVLRQVTQEASSYVDSCVQAGERIGERVQQARRVLDFNTA